MTTNEAGIRLDQKLLGPGPLESRIRAALLYLRELPAHQDFKEFLSSTLHAASAPTLQAALDAVVGLDHVGFIAPDGLSIAMLKAVAAECGFSRQHHTVPSTIVARELSERQGNQPLKVTIFRCVEDGPRGFAAEMFLPDTHANVTEGWIAAGVCTHVAFRVRKLAQVGELMELLVSDGFVMPKFMRASSMKNPNDGTCAVYFDPGARELPCRIEFFHRDPGH